MRAFREKRSQWVEWLHGEDFHSVWKQIGFLFWNHAWFCTVNELRRLAENNESSKAGFNAPIIRLFNTGFVTMQAVTIRRLNEKPKMKPKPKWAVISLRRIVDDIRKNMCLITRENYVAYDGLPYDTEPAKNKWIEERTKQEQTDVCGWAETNGPNAWSISALMHDDFDRLAKVNPSDRRRCDLISDEWFDYLENQLQPCGSIKIYVDKFIAHAADPETRSELVEKQLRISLDSLEQCHRAIYRVAAFLYGPLLWEGSYGALPTPQYDHLKNIDKPWIAPQDIEKAHEAWERQVSKFERLEDEQLWPNEE